MLGSEQHVNLFCFRSSRPVLVFLSQTLTCQYIWCSDSLDSCVLVCVGSWFYVWGRFSDLYFFFSAKKIGIHLPVNALISHTLVRLSSLVMRSVPIEVCMKHQPYTVFAFFPWTNQKTDTKVAWCGTQQRLRLVWLSVVLFSSCVHSTNASTVAVHHLQHDANNSCSLLNPQVVACTHNTSSKCHTPVPSCRFTLFTQTLIRLC